MPASKQPLVLIAEDDPTLADSVREALDLQGYQVTCVEDGDLALDLIDEQRFDVVLTDFQMSVMSGMELLEAIKAQQPRLPVIMMTGHSTTDLAIQATKRGAFDYIIKPFEVPDLLETLSKAAASSRLARKSVTMGESHAGTDAIVGNSRKMQEVFKEIGRVAERPIPVLIRGETGTGKELVARAIYHYSNRADKPFVAVNCAAIPDTLIESELFGHEKGAFTHAITQRLGRFEQAQGGTLFLDEIGDLPWPTQAKLLRVLQEKVISRVGGKEDIPIDVRILSATHRDLEKMIVEGRFREDLYFRLNATIITLPPLRERLEDLDQLGPYFAVRYAREFEMDTPRIHRNAMVRLGQHHWPGNIRELENVIRRSLIECRGMSITRDVVDQVLESVSSRDADQSDAIEVSTEGFEDHIRKVLFEASRGELDDRGALPILIDELERILYQQAVVLAHGNQTSMAKWIGVSRLTIREKLDKYALFPKREKRA
ncbi:MAG: response regulator [Verrucomicrobiaceae bacterium]|nr:response regulator [Verrucomicrobiaceae bacterium]